MRPAPRSLIARSRALFPQGVFASIVRFRASFPRVIARGERVEHAERRETISRRPFLSHLSRVRSSAGTNPSF